MEQGAAKFNSPTAQPLMSKTTSKTAARRPMSESPAQDQPLAARHDEFESIAVALDMAGVEMAADHKHWAVRKAPK